jgi:hypothetical protein
MARAGEPVCTRAGGQEITAELWDAFDRAITAVGADWEQVAEDSPAQEEVRGLLAQVAAAVGRAARGEAAAVDGLPRTVLTRRLVDLTRRHLVGQAERLSPPTGRCCPARPALRDREGALGPGAGLGPALRRPALGAGRHGTGGRGGPRPPLPADLHPLSGRDAAARPQRADQRGAGTPARADLLRRVRALLPRQRRDRAGARGRSAGGPRPAALLDRGHLRVGAGHRAADRRGEGAVGPPVHAAGGLPGGAPRWRFPGCSST